MTEFESLIATRNQWQLMLITGEGKDSYPPSDLWKFWCACCEYTGHVGDVDAKKCNACPLNGYAWSDYDVLVRGYYVLFRSPPCERKGAFYREYNMCKYSGGGQKAERYWVERMVYACNQAIIDYLLR